MGVLSSCFTSKLTKEVKRMYRSELYIDYQYVSYQGSNDSQSFYFAIDSLDNRKFRYYGRLIINNLDTIQLSGFKKGSLYYSSSDRNCNTMIEARGPLAQIRDSVTIELCNVVSESTTLYRTYRRNVIREE